MSPTYLRSARAKREWARLDRRRKAAFLDALPLFVEGVRTGRFHPRLRVKGVSGYPGLFEMSYAPDGRLRLLEGPPLADRLGHRGDLRADPPLLVRRQDRGPT